MAVLLGLHCFAWAFSSPREHRLLTGVVPFVEHRLYVSRFQ